MYSAVTLKTLLLLTLFLTTGCVLRQNPPTIATSNTMTLCDDTGCHERAKNYASFEAATVKPAEDSRMVALEQMAANDPRAAYDLALRFFRGDGVKQDSYRSIKWMREAAEKGHLEAQKALGRLYLTGLAEMGADYGEAQKWLSITAARGDKEAKKLLREATAARQSELNDYQWRSHWQPIFYNGWYSAYRYNWYWNNTGWYLY